MMTQNRGDPTIMLVDDEDGVLTSLKVTLRQAGLKNVILCQDSRNALDMLEQSRVSVLLLDLYMPYLSGEDLLGQLVESHPDVPIIVVTGAVDVETAVRCMKTGAFDYLTKPVEAGPLLAAVQRAIALRELREENEALRRHLLTGSLQHAEAFSKVITINRQMTSIFQYLESVASTSKPILITGETGTGKELMAQAVHQLSGRQGEYVVVNAAGLSDQFFDDTLFGHAKGAFSGATQNRAGMLKKADHGTLVLDEVGDLSLTSQVKLLRLLQSGEYQRLGDDEIRRGNARIIALTNRDLWALQADGRFRKDLIFRLRTHHVELPPLRQRVEDLPLLVEFFLSQACDQLGKKVPATPKELLGLLSAYDFPGNVRELQSMLFDALSTHESKVLSLASLKKHMDQSRLHAPAPLSKAEQGVGIAFPAKLPNLKEMADLLVEEALRRAQGNQSIAAQLLGITPAAVSKRLKRKKAG